MAESSEQFTIGAEVSCTDGPCGTLTRMVLDPVAEVVTHLIVQPRREREPARLVPVELVDSAAGEIRLKCASAEFDSLDPAKQGQFIGSDNDVPDYRTTDTVAWPYFGYRGARRPTTRSPRARWRCSAASTLMPPTATSARSKGWSSTPPAIT
jgi:hypothetical protein